MLTAPSSPRFCLKYLPFALVVSLFVSAAHAQWTLNGSPICTAQYRQGDPAIIPDENGGAILCWTDSRDGIGQSDIYAQRVNNMGIPQWQTGGIPICRATGSQGSSAIVSDGQGGAFIFWSDFRGGVFGDIYAQRITAGGQLQWDASGVLICGAARTQERPSMVADGAGGAIAIWQDERVQYQDDLFMQRVNQAGVPAWAPDGVPLTSVSSGKHYSSVASDEAGGLLAIWTENREAGTDTDIYVQRVSDNGLPYWDPEGVAVCTAYFLQNSGDIVSDSNGGAIAVWGDCRAAWWGDCGFSDIYAQRVDENGSTLWETDGAAVTLSIPADLHPRLVSDSEGGAVITWHLDFFGIYAQRISPLGALLWAPDGVPVSSGSQSQYDNRMISDGRGGAIIAWKDDVPNLNDDISANRIDADGQLLWGSNGVPICTVSAEQQYHVLASDGWSGAIIAWQDNRSGVNTEDIYAQRVTGTGSILTGVRDLRLPAFSLSEFTPNPFANNTTIQLELPNAAAVSIEVYDAAGRLITKSQASFGSGRYKLEFDGTNGQGRRLPSGAYFARVSANGSSVTRKMIILR